MSNQPIAIVLETLINGLSPVLQGMGFELKKKKSFIKMLEECSQEFNIQFRRIKGQEAGYVEACPNIIFENLEKMAANLKGEEYKKGWPTAAGNIGNLQPKREFIEWPLTLTSNISDLIEIITIHIEKIAKPFWNDFSNLDKLIKGYEEADPRLTLNGHSFRWRLVAAYCLIKEYEKAITTLKEWETGRPSDSMIEQGIDKIIQLMYV
ncbi:DUF4304 domain-containing protein [Paenibacillus macerans]|uniref:DUF4304 domain-containing protein n=1 Tax=Paenibacillus macerans TaxID=44252 RepID=UPI0020423115|nr:DUF4304 domain-containing protein [Paenibacillus macerans]MCM3702385.1 DUF4304 domain-containing protein [Paenibacillus macerans]